MADDRGSGFVGNCERALATSEGNPLKGLLRPDGKPNVGRPNNGPDGMPNEEGKGRLKDGAPGPDGIPPAVGAPGPDGRTAEGKSGRPNVGTVSDGRPGNPNVGATGAVGRTKEPSNVGKVRRAERSRVRSNARFWVGKGRAAKSLAKLARSDGTDPAGRSESADWRAAGLVGRSLFNSERTEEAMLLGRRLPSCERAEGRAARRETGRAMGPKGLEGVAGVASAEAKLARSDGTEATGRSERADSRAAGLVGRTSFSSEITEGAMLLGRMLPSCESAEGMATSRVLGRAMGKGPKGLLVARRLEAGLAGPSPEAKLLTASERAEAKGALVLRAPGSLASWERAEPSGPVATEESLASCEISDSSG